MNNQKTLKEQVAEVKEREFLYSNFKKYDDKNPKNIVIGLFIGILIAQCSVIWNYKY